MADKHESRHGSTEITIPADYLEDVRSALVREVVDGGKFIASNHNSVLEADSELWAATTREDRAASVRSLHGDMRLLDQVIDARIETKVTGDEHALWHTLEGMVHVLSGRLTHECGFGPITMGAVLELAERLRWAADEAIRISPGPDDSKVA
jgi:hypothetical protein